jgi:hypothetical protein
MKYPPVFYWVVILTGCAASSRMTAAPIAMAAPVTKAAPVPTLDLYNWPSTDPRVSAASFKEGVTTIDKVEAVLGKCPNYKADEDNPGEHYATWNFDHPGEAVVVGLKFKPDGKLKVKYIHTTTLQ